MIQNRTKRIFCFLFAYCTMLYSNSSYGQQLSIDSMLNVLALQKEDTNKVSTLLSISKYYREKPDNLKSLQYADLALAIAKKIHDKRGEGDSYLNMGLCFYSMYNYKGAVKNDSLAILCFKEINDKAGLALACERLGIALQYYGNWPDAIKITYEALDIYQQLGNLKKVAMCQSWIGFVYYWNAEYDHAFNALNEAIKKYETIGHEGHAGECYIYLANILRTRKKYKEALAYDSIGLKIAIKKQNFQISANAYFSIADIMVTQMDETIGNDLSNKEIKLLNGVLKLYHQSLNHFRAASDSGGMGDNYQRLAEINTRLRKYDIAKNYADTALLIAKKIQYKDNFKWGYWAKMKIDSATGNFEDALESYKQFIIYRDSISNEQNIRKATETEMQYQFDKKEAVKKNEQLKKDAEIKRVKNLQYFTIASLAVIIMSVLIIVGFQLRNNKQKQKTNIALQQQKERVETALSELKSTQSQLIQAEKMASLGELTAGIAHEIQNPLNFVNNFSELNTELISELVEEVHKGNTIEVITIVNDIKANEEKINHHGKRADAIVKGMLQHSRSSNGIKEPTDINALCGEYLRLSYHGLRAKDKSFNASMKTDFDPSVEKINIMRQDMGRVILNLITNAFYAVAEKKKQQPENYEPTVTVSTKKINNLVEIRIKDNGNGIPQKNLGKIFQPFFTTKPTGQGTGLGLSLSYDIITKGHAGELKVETKEGEFAEFVITL